MKPAPNEVCSNIPVNNKRVSVEWTLDLMKGVGLIDKGTEKVNQLTAATLSLVCCDGCGARQGVHEAFKAPVLLDALDASGVGDVGKILPGSEVTQTSEGQLLGRAGVHTLDLWTHEGDHDCLWIIGDDHVDLVAPGQEEHE